MSEELFEKYLTGTLSDDETRRLTELLADPAESRRFAGFVQEWTLLADLSRRLSSVERIGDAESRPRRRPSSRFLAAYRPRRATGARVWWMLASAASMLLAAGLYWGTRPVPAPGTITRHEPEPAPEVPAPTPVPPLPPAPPKPDPLPPLEPPVPRPEQAPVPVAPRTVSPAPPPAPEPRPVTPETKAVAAAVAELERVQGGVWILAPEGRIAARPGQPLLAEQGLETAKDARAWVTYRDGTALDLAPATVVDRLSDDGAKRVILAQGTLVASVVKQPKPMTLSTPNGEATVLGTQFTLTAQPDSTRLEVLEGRVRLTRRADTASVDVTAGHAATVAKGVPFESKVFEILRSYQDGVSPAVSYAGTADTSLSEVDATHTAGLDAKLEVDGDEVGKKAIWGLLRFDLSDLPPRAVVRTVVLTLRIEGTSQGAGYSLFEVKRPWVEAEATWRSFAAGRNWTWAGARAPADRGARPLGTVAPREKGELPVLLNDAGVALVQQWVRNPATNHGFLLGSDANADGFKFESREAVAPDRRPKLTVAYTLGPSR